MIYPLSYIVPGEPLHIARSTKIREPEWTHQKHLMANFRISLERQHKGALLQGPIEIRTHLYLNPDHFTPSKQKTNHLKIINLMHFIEEAARNVLYTENCNIHEFHAKMFFSHNNRTEIFIKPVND